MKRPISVTHSAPSGFLTAVLVSCASTASEAPPLKASHAVTGGFNQCLHPAK
jgi:hypothetical protein